MVYYLSIIEVAAIHSDQIEVYGGAYGIRDRGALDAACYRPQSGYYNSIAEQAAALMESLLFNHPFIDGNKRISFAATYTFLSINGYELRVAPMEAYDFMMKLLNNRGHSFSDIVSFLDENTVKTE